MRTVKFRAWCRNMQEMIEVTDLHISEKNPWVKDGFGGFTKNFELLQWTGLKDKNGIEIYEGDIVRPRRYKNTKTYNFPVVFKNGKFMFEHKLAGYQTLHESLKNGKRANNDFEVIGNIYENPELLKGA